MARAIVMNGGSINRFYFMLLGPDLIESLKAAPCCDSDESSLTSDPLLYLQSFYMTLKTLAGDAKEHLIRDTLAWL